MFSFKYFLPCEPKKEVCQVMFLNTLGISKKVVLNVFQKKIEDGCLQKDKRGRKKGKTLTGKRVMNVITHIKMFKCVESHYVRKNSKYQYLAQELSVAEMHRVYKKWCAEEKMKTESYDFYKWVFTSLFKLKFQKPKKDKCATCTAYLNKPSRSEQEEEEQRKHQSDKAYTRKIKEERKKESEENEEVCCAAFDLQQVLLSPFGQTGDFYYSRRLKNHNFTITEISTMGTWCYLWHEGEENKGACEISTSLFKYLCEMKKQGVRKVYLFSDACGGQNRNRFVLIMLSYAVRLLDFDFIDMMYLFSGHSQNENDNAHSVIEQHTRKLTIYTTSQWETNIQNSFINNKVVVNVLTHNDFLNFKSKDGLKDYERVFEDKVVITTEVPRKSTRKFQLSNFIKEDDCKKVMMKVMWSKVVNVRFTNAEPSKMKLKYEYEKDFIEADFCELQNVNRISRKKFQLYKEAIGISSLKKSDLLKLCSKNLIPGHHQNDNK